MIKQLRRLVNAYDRLESWRRTNTLGYKCPDYIEEMWESEEEYSEFYAPVWEHDQKIMDHVEKAERRISDEIMRILGDDTMNPTEAIWKAKDIVFAFDFDRKRSYYEDF